MRVKQVNINGFRSIGNATLDKCGRFNVLIGKNNAGKSNVLLAIDAFFTAVKAGSVAALSSKSLRERDFAKGSTKGNQFAVTIRFDIDPELRQTLARAIAAESPQVATAAEQLKNAADLLVTIVFDKRLDGSYVSKLSFVADDSENVLLEVSCESANQLLSDMLQIQTLQSQHAALDDLLRFPRQMGMSFERIKEDPEYLRHMLYSRRAISIEKHSSSRIKEIIDAAENEEAFSQSIYGEQKILQEKIDELNEKPLATPVRTFGGTSSTIPGYARSLLERLSMNKVLYLRERREPIGKAEAKRLLELKVRRGGTEQLRRIQDVVSALLGVEIDAFQADSGSRGDSEAELDVDSFLVQVNGAGIREALRLVLDFEFEQPHILLVEEPEIHLHPALESSMMRYLKECGSRSQVFITTHSTNFLDTAELSNVYLISRTPETMCDRLGINDLEAKIPRELGIRLSSLFMYDRIVFVEGTSDEEVLREFASKLNVNLASANVGFVPMGGVRNLAYFAAESTLDFLANRQVKMWFVIDRDEREDAEIDAIKGRLCERAKLVAFSRRELENFLLVPEALCKLISQKITNAGDFREGPTSDQIAAALTECADELVTVAIERRAIKALCISQFPNRRRVQDGSSGKPIEQRIREELGEMGNKLAELSEKIDEVMSVAKSEVEKEWASSKLDIVPGDLLIDAVCQRYGVRFRKERDSVRLSSLMSESQVGEEMKALLNELVAD